MHQIKHYGIGGQMLMYECDRRGRCAGVGSVANFFFVVVVLNL